VIKIGRTALSARVLPWVDLILFLFLGLAGTWVITYRPWSFDAPSAAALAGAMYGGAAVLLGNWINRFSEWRRLVGESALRLEKIKILIAAELVDVAIGLIESKRLMDAAITSLHAGGPVSPMLNLRCCLPRPLSLTDSLGTEILKFEGAAIDALTTLRANLSITTRRMEAITGGETFGLLTATELSNGLAHDLEVLSQAVRLVAPNRKVAIRSGRPELLIDLLQQAASPASNLRPQPTDLGKH
jgi:hypothetical protein